MGVDGRDAGRVGEVRDGGCIEMVAVVGVRRGLERPTDAGRRVANAGAGRVVLPDGDVPEHQLVAALNRRPIVTT